MLKVEFRRAALLACAWVVWAPTTHAAETPSSEQTVFVLFKHYQGWRDEPLQDWRELNDRVGEIGGWRTYLREAQPGGDIPDESGHAHHGH